MIVPGGCGTFPRTGVVGLNRSSAVFALLTGSKYIAPYVARGSRLRTTIGSFSGT